MPVLSPQYMSLLHVAIEPLSVRIATAVQITGISPSRLYELIHRRSGDCEGRRPSLRVAF